MIDRDHLVRIFRRTIISTEFTRPYLDWDENTRAKFQELIQLNDLAKSAVILYFKKIDQWLLLTTKDLYFKSPDKPIDHVLVDEVVSARIDLRINKENGFSQGKGFSIITLSMIDGHPWNINIEHGSATEGVLRVLTEMIRNRPVA
ncbi:hypothetical protein [Rhodoferax sp. TH121]|uniref:hypothetical protein n=1 Tax=Rhodoferax sp. TH121 TaxID=2022803 RepID=UPI0011403F59|nr:hypothetical protein [Rhodoferax sp. TH121]